jgi:hypothetical protein
MAWGWSATYDNIGNVYTCGHFEGTVDFNPGPGVTNLTSAGLYDIYLTKMDASGNLIWAKSFGSSTNDWGEHVVSDASGNIYLSGRYEETIDFDPGAGVALLTAVDTTDYFILKLNSSGNFVWAKSVGGKLADGHPAVVPDAAGNIYYSGYFSDTADFDPGPGVYTLSSAGIYDIFISKLDASGNLVWAKRIGDVGEDNANDIAFDNAGNLYVVGDFQGAPDFDPGAGTTTITAAGTYDIFIAKFDPLGNFIWARSIGGPDYDFGLGVAVDPNNRIYIAGSFRDMAVCNNGTGGIQLTSSGDFDAFVSRLDTSGNFLWAKNLGGSSYDQAYGMAVDIYGSVYSTGYFNGTADFDPGAGNYNFTAPSQGIFISKLDTLGDFAWAGGFIGTSGLGMSVDVDNMGNIYCTGQFEGTADFDPGAGNATLSSNGSPDAFIIKLTQPGFITGIEDLQSTDTWSFYPNPAADKLNISIGVEATLTIFDAQGQLVLQTAISKGSRQLEISNLASGFYMMRLTTPSGNDTKSFIKK